jgi:hypothetical protein
MAIGFSEVLPQADLIRYSGSSLEANLSKLIILLKM